MGLEEVNGLEGVRKERKSKPWQYMMWKSENGSRHAQSNESKESKGLMASLRIPRMRNNVVGPRKLKDSVKTYGNAKLRKGSRKPK